MIASPVTDDRAAERERERERENYIHIYMYMWMYTYTRCTYICSPELAPGLALP